MDSRFKQTLLRSYLVAELRQLAASTAGIPGIYVLPRIDTLYVWDGVIFLQRGLYNNATFKFQLHIPPEFPNSVAPVVKFCSQIFHPQIDQQSFELNVRTKFPIWRSPWDHGALDRDKGQSDWIWHLLAYMRRIFHKIDTKEPFNERAAKMYTSDIDMYKVKVEECIRNADIDLHSSDDMQIEFSKWRSEIHQPVLDEIIGRKDDEEITDAKSQPQDADDADDDADDDDDDGTHASVVVNTIVDPTSSSTVSPNTVSEVDSTNLTTLFQDPPATPPPPQPTFRSHTLPPDDYRSTPELAHVQTLIQPSNLDDCFNQQPGINVQVSEPLHPTTPQTPPLQIPSPLQIPRLRSRTTFQPPAVIHHKVTTTTTTTTQPPQSLNPHTQTAPGNVAAADMLDDLMEA